jgi:hypothetical protein
VHEAAFDVVDGVRSRRRITVRRSGLKVIGAEVLIQGFVLEHVIDCGEDGGSDGLDRPAGLAPGDVLVVIAPPGET